jgi:copper chaperone NosL
MKKLHVLYMATILVLLLSAVLYGQNREDIGLHRECRYCGMDRGSFDFSRMLIVYDDGTTAAFCSIRCAAVDIANKLDSTPAKISVGDFISRELIDAEKAHWVIGGSRPGVMSGRGKWAFATKEDAAEFVKQNGGSHADFETSMKAAYEDLYSDTRMIREKRKMRRMQHKSHEHMH